MTSSGQLLAPQQLYTFQSTHVDSSRPTNGHTNFSVRCITEIIELLAQSEIAQEVRRGNLMLPHPSALLVAFNSCPNSAQLPIVAPNRHQIQSWLIIHLCLGTWLQLIHTLAPSKEHSSARAASFPLPHSGAHTRWWFPASSNSCSQLLRPWETAEAPPSSPTSHRSLFPTTNSLDWARDSLPQPNSPEQIHHSSPNWACHLRPSRSRSEQRERKQRAESSSQYPPPILKILGWGQPSN